MDMNRADFMRAAPAALVAIASLPEVPESRQPLVGYIHANDVAGEVAAVHLDGVDVDMVFECNDVEGWLRRYAGVSRERGDPAVQYLTGKVEVFWK